MLFSPKSLKHIGTAAETAGCNSYQENSSLFIAPNNETPIWFIVDRFAFDHFTIPSFFNLFLFGFTVFTGNFFFRHLPSPPYWLVIFSCQLTYLLPMFLQLGESHLIGSFNNIK